MRGVKTPRARRWRTMTLWTPMAIFDAGIWQRAAAYLANAVVKWRGHNLLTVISFVWRGHVFTPEVS